MEDYREELVQLAKLSIMGNPQDIRLYVARLIQKFRKTDKDISDELNAFLKDKPEGRSSILRGQSPEGNWKISDVDNSISREIPGFLTRVNIENTFREPLLNANILKALNSLTKERREIAKLVSAGLKPSCSAFFIGKPGVGKTITAKWLSRQLQLPLFVLDLASIMSSYLGQTGTNLKLAFSYAKSEPCIILLDEIDAIAKKRDDDSDVGEIKRIVTVILQEIDNWSTDSILIAATNHPELVDSALWRRFDHVLEFDLPDKKMIRAAIPYFLESDYQLFEKYEDVLTLLFESKSFSEIKRILLQLRRELIIEHSTVPDTLNRYIESTIFDKKKRIELAKTLMNTGEYSHHAINEMTGVSRDTLRKYRDVIPV